MQLQLQSLKKPKHKTEKLGCNLHTTLNFSETTIHEDVVKFNYAPFLNKLQIIVFTITMFDGEIPNVCKQIIVQNVNFMVTN